MAEKQRLVVIGNGMVGHNLIEKLVENEAAQQYEITIFCEESRLAYDRVHLSEFFAGKSAEDLALTNGDLYRQNGITVRVGCAATEIDREQKIVVADNGDQTPYDMLVLATGSFPFVPPMPGHDRARCLVYRTIEDLEALTEAAAKSKVGAVVGGGLLGLGAAKAVKDLGLETHVIEFAPRLMAVQIDDGGSAILRSKIEALGVQVHTGKNTTEIVDGESAFHRMNFADGGHLETDLVLFSAGIRPQDALARSSGLELGERGGIVVNNQCQTSDPAIYAIGECALWSGRIFGLVAPGYQMAGVVASHLAGDVAAFTGADMSTKLKLMGVDVASIGDAHGNTEGSRSYIYSDQVDEVYKKIVVDAKGDKLLGAVLVGDAKEYGSLLQYMLNEIQLPEHPDDLILPQRDGSAAVGLGPDMLPETAMICSCHDVTKGAIVAAIDDGATDLPALKTCTRASTGCGGCAPLLKSLLDEELDKRGLEVNTDICEHFAYTRQDLYSLVRVGQIKTFGELLAKHGSGNGCELCKPAVGSILASCWNDYVLQKPHFGLQDTNDRYLANMQKDGTYSIVPRVPGGEITPDKLIALGQVAKEYDLYTKITGGQRVDLFGARMDQLPAIWSKLIDAGFETGHAYGKSLRTVKSCVGSTWCRYGVDDSAGLAVELEHRYKGLRSPHKLKFGVSGCTRECAEAQSKDIGIIATENGWNLYVCGNGGMRPRHGDLFATDLDKATLIQYIDRLLMFYVSNADRLQRTSVWMENLEGGLDYLRSVVIDDRLGINAELELQMQAVIDSYACEWKAAVEDPESVKRFSHFVNSDKGDSNVVFVRERDQIRPAVDAEKESAEPA
ncbi:MAG: nitrite reductase large subunit [Immundisolibacteraceae bacterium]|nr:nitrite reductase large subunit [Immundisolibacteraceae bacterium]